MTAPRKPALTSAEWMEVTADDPVWWADRIADLAARIEGFTQTDTPRHALAALALHNLKDTDGRPLGFTREHLAACRESVEWDAVNNGECPRCGPDKEVGWKMPSRPICTECGFQPRRPSWEVNESLIDLADIIEALLPPE